MFEKNELLPVLVPGVVVYIVHLDPQHDLCQSCNLKILIPIEKSLLNSLFRPTKNTIIYFEQRNHVENKINRLVVINSQRKALVANRLGIGWIRILDSR